MCSDSETLIFYIATDKRGYPHNIFLISPQKHMLWVFIRSACFRGEIRKYQHFSDEKSALPVAVALLKDEELE